MPLTTILAALSVAAIWGINVLTIRVAVAEIPPIMLTAIRFAAVAALCLPFIKMPWDRIKQILILSVVFGTGHFGLMFYGLTMVEAGPTGILLQLGVPFSSLLAMFVFGDKLGAYRLGAMAMAFCGVVILMWDPAIAEVGYGAAAIVICAFFWAVSNIQIKKIGEIGPMQLNGAMAVFAAPQLFLLSLLIEDQPIQAVMTASWVPFIAITYTVVMSSMIAYGLWYHLLKTRPVNQVVPFTLVAPVVAVGAAALFLDEPLTLNRVIGGLVVLASVAVIIFRTPPARQPATEE